MGDANEANEQQNVEAVQAPKRNYRKNKFNPRGRRGRGGRGRGGRGRGGRGRGRGWGREWRSVPWASNNTVIYGAVNYYTYNYNGQETQPNSSNHSQQMQLPPPNVPKIPIYVPYRNPPTTTSNEVAEEISKMQLDDDNLEEKDNSQ